MFIGIPCSVKQSILLNIYSFIVNTGHHFTSDLFVGPSFNGALVVTTMPVDLNLRTRDIPVTRSQLISSSRPEILLYNVGVLLPDACYPLYKTTHVREIATWPRAGFSALT